MQPRAGGATPTQHATPFFTSSSTTGTTASAASSSTTSLFSSSRTRTNTNTTNDSSHSHQQQPSQTYHNYSRSLSRPATSSGDRPETRSTDNSQSQSGSPAPPTVSVFEQDPVKERPRVLTKERKPSFGRKSSFTSSSPSKSKQQPQQPQRRTNSISNSTSTAAGATTNGPAGHIITDSSAPPALPPDFTLSAVANIARVASRDSEAVVVQSPTGSGDSFSKMLSRTAPTPVNGYTAVAPSVIQASSSSMATENAVVYGHIQEMANKRISTLDYLRKAHEGRVHWFNTLLFTQSDLSRLPSYASARIARRATNYLLLGLSLPAVIDFNSNTPVEFLKSLNLLLNEFETFQSLHSDGSSSSSLTRNRIPQMFRRVPGGGKTRRTSGQASDIGLPMGASQVSLISTNADSGYGGSGGGSFSQGGGGGLGGGGSGVGGPAEGVMQFGAAESELLPGEEYTYLLTPSLPFEPDFFETFATLCDVLIDGYTKLMTLLPSPKECNQQVAELFAKADSKVRKIIVEGCVKEFQDHARSGARTEMAGVGKVVLGGLM
ncbi:hypothetical protein MKZ38_004808 [Zalerion maritima]|uniref:Uncharacterized protein n=1 Tax=Zalerion maritima TaxID=339359 RepID=A0AAD5RLY1_9PEZI|nr:hypothetical protein MKZ38_004808 [Zalerion maritima]